MNRYRMIFICIWLLVFSGLALAGTSPDPGVIAGVRIASGSILVAVAVFARRGWRYLQERRRASALAAALRHGRV